MKAVQKSSSLEDAYRAYETKDYRTAISIYREILLQIEDESAISDLNICRHFFAFGKSILEYARHFSKEYLDYLQQREEYAEVKGSLPAGLAEEGETSEELQDLSSILPPEKYFDMAEQVFEVAITISRNAITEVLNSMDTKKATISASMGPSSSEVTKQIKFKKVSDACREELRLPINMCFSSMYNLILCKLEQGVSTTLDFKELFAIAIEHGFSVTEMVDGTFSLYTFFNVLSDYYEEKKLKKSLEEFEKTVGTTYIHNSSYSIEKDSMQLSHVSTSSVDSDIPPEELLIDILKDLHTYYSVRLANSKLMTKRSILGQLRQTKEGISLEDDATENLRLLERKLHSLNCGFKNYLVEKHLSTTTFGQSIKKSHVNNFGHESISDGDISYDYNVQEQKTPSTNGKHRIVSLSTLRDSGVSEDTINSLKASISSCDKPIKLLHHCADDSSDDEDFVPSSSEDTSDISKSSSSSSEKSSTSNKSSTRSSSDSSTSSSAASSSSSSLPSYSSSSYSSYSYSSSPSSSSSS